MEKMGSPEPAHPSPGAGLVAGVSVAQTAGTEGDEVEAVVPKLFHCACMRRLLPLAYREELYHVLRLTGPLLLSRILSFLLTFVTTIFCGHIGNGELAGLALAQASINVSTVATGFGLALACDTLISQTYGGKNLKRVGVILQRGLLILLLFCLPCWGLLINCQNVLLLLHQEEETARIAQLYVMAFLPAVPAIFLHQLLVAYLQNQGIILPQMYTAAVANILNLGANYILIISLDLGAVGSAIANSLSHISLCLLLYGYIRWKKLYQQTWGGWSTECLQEWGSYMKLAIPSTFMVCFEWWIWDLGGFLAGLLGEEDLAAQHVLLEVGAITYMFPLGVHAAACVRVGNALGAGNTTRALITCKVALVLAGTIAVFQGFAMAGCGPFVAYIFTSDENIVAIVAENMMLYPFLQFFDAIMSVCLGILIGAGMQKIAALSNLVCYYFVSLPLGVALMFYAKLRILGFWLGIIICVILEVVFYLCVISKLNWKKITQKAQQRARKKMVVIPMRPASTVLNEAMVPDFSNKTTQMNAEEDSKADGYSLVNTQDQELKVGDKTETSHINTGGAEGDAEHSKNTSSTKTQAPLSITELILRRGSVFLFSLLTLAIGVAIYIAFPVPEFSGHKRDNFTLNWNNDSTPTPLAPLDLTPNV